MYFRGRGLTMNEINLAKTTFKSHLDKGQILPITKVQNYFGEEHKLESKLFSKWFQMITDFSFLESPKQGIEEIFIFSPTEIIYKYNDKKIAHSTDITAEDLQTALDCMVIRSEISWNFSTPFVSFQSEMFGYSVRITLSHYSISSKNKSSCFIRFQSKAPFSLDRFGNVPNDLIRKLIIEKKNILVSGGTGSGKTSFLNSMLSLTSNEEHLIFLEDTAELISPHTKTTNLITNELGKNNKLNNYVSYALRMSPDRLILGEIRSKEVEPFLLAMNTGHKGLISTIHANSAMETLNRIALLFKIYGARDLSFELVLKLVCTNIDAVIFLEDKKVAEIIQVFGSEQSNIFFENIFSKDD